MEITKEQEEAIRAATRDMEKLTRGIEQGAKQIEKELRRLDELSHSGVVERFIEAQENALREEQRIVAEKLKRERAINDTIDRAIKDTPPHAGRDARMSRIFDYLQDAGFIDFSYEEAATAIGKEG